MPQVQPPGSSSPGAGKGPRGGALAGQPETSQRGAGSLQSRALGQVHCLSGSVHCPVCPPGLRRLWPPGVLDARAAQLSISRKWLAFGQAALRSPALLSWGRVHRPHPSPPLRHCVSASCHTDGFRGVRSQAAADFIAATVCIWSCAGGRGGQL